MDRLEVGYAVVVVLLVASLATSAAILPAPADTDPTSAPGTVTGQPEPEDCTIVPGSPVLVVPADANRSRSPRYLFVTTDATLYVLPLDSSDNVTRGGELDPTDLVTYDYDAFTELPPERRFRLLNRTTLCTERPDSSLIAGETTRTVSSTAITTTTGGLRERRGDQPTVPDLPLDWVWMLLGVAVVGLLGVTIRRAASGDASSAEDPEGGDAATDEADVAVGRAAGRAADRIVDAGEFENEVYRAWAEMTRPLPVDGPRTTTPREFERAAVEAGIDDADAAALTDLFEEVRYGDAPATPERERRALAVLRRVEDRYGDDE